MMSPQDSSRLSKEKHGRVGELMHGMFEHLEEYFRRLSRQRYRPGIAILRFV